MAKTRFQAVQNSLVIPTIWRAVRSQDIAAVMAGLRATAQVGKILRIRLRNGGPAPDDVERHLTAMNARLRRWIALSVHAQFSFHALTTGINLR